MIIISQKPQTIMNHLLDIILPHKYNSKELSFLLLLLRVIIGFLFLKHGLEKWNNFELLQNTFPDPWGISSRSSLILAIFSELICSIGFILGFLFRLATLPMITTMGVAYFMVHSNDPFATKELAFIYLVLFLILLITGPGKYSIDYLMGKALDSGRNKHSRIRKPIA